mgnify:CR=1 FL=1
MFEKLEKRFNLPPLEKAFAFLTGPTGKRIESIILSLDKLSKDASTIHDVTHLLELIERMDKEGTLDKLNITLRSIGPLTRSKNLKLVLDKLDKFEAILKDLLGDSSASKS